MKKILLTLLLSAQSFANISCFPSGPCNSSSGSGSGGGTVTAVTASSPLSSSGGTAPNISLSGTVSAANGGTGQSSLTSNNVLLGNGTSAVQFVAPGTNGNVLTSNGTTWTSAAATGSITGSGTANTFTKWTGTSSIGNSQWLEGSNGEMQYQNFSAAKGTATVPLFDMQPGTGNGLFTDSSGHWLASTAGILGIGINGTPEFELFDNNNSTSDYWGFRNVNGVLIFQPFGTGTGVVRWKMRSSGDTSFAQNLQTSAGSTISDWTAFSSTDASNPNLTYFQNNVSRNLVEGNDGHGSGILEANVNTVNAWTVQGAADITNVRGTTTANATSSITGSSTLFTQDFGLHDRISLSSAASTYCYVRAITSDTAMTVDNGSGGSCTLGDGSSQTFNKKQALLNIQNNARLEALYVDDQAITTVSGPMVVVKRITSGVVVLSGGSNSTPALDASLGDTFLLSSSVSPTLAIPTNPLDGQKITIEFTASGGTQTLSLNSGTGGFEFGTDITALTATSSGVTDLVGCIYSASKNKWLVVSYIRGF